MDYYGDMVIIHIICLYFIFVKQNHHFLVVMEVAAMTPLITIQILGLIYRMKEKNSKISLVTAPASAEFESLDDYDIIEL